MANNPGAPPATGQVSAEGAIGGYHRWGADRPAREPMMHSHCKTRRLAIKG